jgi:hypothetical protein
MLIGLAFGLLAWGGPPLKWLVALCLEGVLRDFDGRAGHKTPQGKVDLQDLSHACPPARLLQATSSCHGVSYSENVIGRLWPKKAILEANGDRVCLSEVVHTICTAIDSHLDIGQGRQMPAGINLQR